MTQLMTPQEKGTVQEKGKDVILDVLARAADDTQFMAQLTEDPKQALEGYYTLSSEELAALTSGDIRKIEEWAGKLDTRHAQWLVNRLGQEIW